MGRNSGLRHTDHEQHGPGSLCLVVPDNPVIKFPPWYGWMVGEGGGGLASWLQNQYVKRSNAILYCTVILMDKRSPRNENLNWHLMIRKHEVSATHKDGGEGGQNMTTPTQTAARVFMLSVYNVF